jgi:pyruvate formate-lyase activating enzyme-like uncharacterized protein
MLNVSVNSSTKEQLEQWCNQIIDNSQDFTDSIYISIEQREKLLDYHRKLQEQLEEIIQMITNNQDIGLSLAIQSIQQVARDFRKQLEQMAIYRASEFFRTHDESVLLNELKTYSLTNRLDLLQEAIDRFQEQAEIAIELSKLLKHISSCDQLQVSSEYHDVVFQNLSNMVG